MTVPTSKFIVDEQPMIVFRPLVHLFGLHEGHLLQQLHYWLHRKSQDPERYRDHFIGGRYWVHWTMPEMQREVPFGTSTTDTHKRVKRRLREMGVLLVDKHGAAWDQTDWYSIDYSVFGQIISRHNASGLPEGRTLGDPSAATPPMHLRASLSSNGGRATADYLTTKKTQKTTTTKDGVVALDVNQPERSSEPMSSALLLEEVPSRLHSAVAALLAHRPDGQRFVDLLALALRRSDAAPADMQIRAPILWLKKLLADPDSVDFTSADEHEEKRRTHALQARLTAERTAAAAARAEEQRTEHAARVAVAQRVISSMQPEELRVLAAAATARHVSRPIAAAVERSVLAGQLPQSPLAQLAVLKALPATHPLGKPSVGGAT